MRWIYLALIAIIILPASAFAYTIEMRLQVSLPGIEDYRIGENNFSSSDNVKVTYSDAYFTGFGSGEAMIALAYAGRIFAFSSLDNTVSPPAVSMVQGSDNKFVIVFSNAQLQDAASDLSSGSVHKSRYGDYEYSSQSSLVYLYARIADAVLNGGIHSQTVIRNRGGSISLGRS